jgi:hypothetical protein
VAKTAILTPFVDLAAEKVGRRKFWKQVLPVTEINYNGHKIDFDPAFHTDLAESFKAGVFDQVPLVFADSKNGHNMDPRNFGGDIIDMEYRGPGREQGTWALIDADREAAKVIQRNPKLGVSARIRQAIEKADGRFFKRGIEHVLLTMNPRVTGMSPWQAVDLSEDADTEVVDLTAAEYTEGTEMGKTATTGRRSQPEIDLSALSDDEFKDLLIDMSTQVQERGISEEDLDDNSEEGDLEDPAAAPVTRRKKSRVKVTKTTERDSEVTPGDEDDDDEGEGDGEGGDADLSERVIRRDEVSQFGQMRIDLAKRDWKTKRGQYLAAGVPPVLLDLAEPVLSQPDEMVIDLAEGEDPIDFRDVLTGMLDNVQNIVDLTDEIGHQVDLTPDDDTTSEADALLAQWDEYSA